MTQLSHVLSQAYDRLLAALGPQHWWPGDGPFEVIVGAVLTQNTSWKNVERAIDNLRDANVTSARALCALPIDELAELVRPAGYYRVKSQRLRNLLAWVIDRYDGSLEAMFQTDLATLRNELLAIHGIGPETADSILLYAGNLPTFVVDTYTHRVLARHGWIDYDAGYDEIKDYFEASLPQDVGLYNEYHALLVRVGKDFCRKSNPKCETCPLADLLPEGGVVEPL